MQFPPKFIFGKAPSHRQLNLPSPRPIRLIWFNKPLPWYLSSHFVTMELHHVGELFTMGSTVSIEERAVLEVQMTKKQIDEKLHRLVVDFSLASPLLAILNQFWVTLPAPGCVYFPSGMTLGSALPCFHFLPSQSNLPSPSASFFTLPLFLFSLPASFLSPYLFHFPLVCLRHCLSSRHLQHAFLGSCHGYHAGLLGGVWRGVHVRVPHAQVLLRRGP